MNQNLELKLQSWLDGELSPAEAQSVSREMKGAEAASLLVAELRSVKTALAGNEMPRTLPESREFYWSKIQRQIEREERAPRPAPVPRPVAPWVRWFSPIAGIGALACLTLLAFRPLPVATAFDETSSTTEGMEAVTFHDQSSGMTVVWLADSDQGQADTQTQSVQSPDSKSGSGPDATVNDPAGDME